jgi:hypothetical protein
LPAFFLAIGIFMGRDPVKRAASQARAEANRKNIPERRATRARSNRHYGIRCYGITPDEFYAFIRQSGGKCPICLRVLQEKQGSAQAVVDHNHVTGKVRGVLCHRCNITIGMLGDDYDNLQRAADYLKPREA